MDNLNKSRVVIVGAGYVGASLHCDCMKDNKMFPVHVFEPEPIVIKAPPLFYFDGVVKSGKQNRRERRKKKRKKR